MTSKNYKKIVGENIRLHRLQAHFYEIVHPEIFNFLEQRRIKHEVRKIKEDYLFLKKDTCAPQEEVICLDVASGTGNLAHHMKSAGFKVVACDLSYYMLKENKSEYKVLCEANYLPIKNEICDTIVAYSGLHHLPNINKALDEICRVASNSSILYFDHDSFLGNRRRLNNVIRFSTHVLWLLTKQEFFKRLLKYAYARKRYRQDIRNINFDVTDGNPVNAREIIKILRNNGFVVEIHDYKSGSLLKAKRRNN